jgi:hypothetical protein
MTSERLRRGRVRRDSYPVPQRVHFDVELACNPPVYGPSVLAADGTTPWRGDTETEREYCDNHLWPRDPGTKGRETACGELFAAHSRVLYAKEQVSRHTGT